MTIRKHLTALSLAAVLGVSACGGDTADTDKITKQATELQESAAKTARDVQSGAVDAEAAAEQLQQEAAETSGAIVDELQSDDRLPEEAQQQLDAAEEQLEGLGG